MVEGAGLCLLCKGVVDEGFPNRALRQDVEENTPHLHIDLDKRVNMPTLNQLVKVGAHRYRFTLGSATPGRHTIRVYWADAKAHKPMGVVRVITITVK